MIVMNVKKMLGRADGQYVWAEGQYEWAEGPYEWAEGP